MMTLKEAENLVERMQAASREAISLDQQWELAFSGLWQHWLLAVVAVGVYFGVRRLAEKKLAG